MAVADAWKYAALRIRPECEETVLENQSVGDKNPQQLDILSEVLPSVIALFRRLDADGRRKLFGALSTVFEFELDRDLASNAPLNSTGGTPGPGRFSQDRSISPKQFLLRKQPRTDVERVACLAYYLTHYREQPYFKTLDVSKLNTEAAQIKFSNPAFSVDNAVKMGYLAQASKGNKQISAPGEMFVAALPDREAAQTAMATARPRRRSKSKRIVREVS